MVAIGTEESNIRNQVFDRMRGQKVSANRKFTCNDFESVFDINLGIQRIYYHVCGQVRHTQ